MFKEEVFRVFLGRKKKMFCVLFFFFFVLCNKVWSLQCLDSGETNGLLFSAVI